VIVGSFLFRVELAEQVIGPVGPCRLDSEPLAVASSPSAFALLDGFAQLATSEGCFRDHCGAHRAPRHGIRLSRPPRSLSTAGLDSSRARVAFSNAPSTAAAASGRGFGEGASGEAKIERGARGFPHGRIVARIDGSLRVVCLAAAGLGRPSAALSLGGARGWCASNLA
jgi:hypothetical protein